MASHIDLVDDEDILDNDLIETEADDGLFLPFLPQMPEKEKNGNLLNRHVTTAAIEADDPLNTSDTTPLRGNIQSDANAGSSSSRGGGIGGGFSSNYLTSSIPGEDRRAPQNTIDETVWQTLSRDLLAVWEKMRQVLYPKYLLGGILGQSGGGIGAAERGEGSTGFGRGLRGLVGRWPDADVVLQSGMSEGLRDWDLWYSHFAFFVFSRAQETNYHRGPLIFCLLLSMFLSMRAHDEQSSLVFSGVFSLVWIGEAIVTLQIKLLGGNMYVLPYKSGVKKRKKRRQEETSANSHIAPSSSPYALLDIPCSP